MKKTTIEGYTVGCFIPVRELGSPRVTVRQAQEHANDLQSALARLTRDMRHVDEVFILPQVSATCSHCGYRWTEPSDTYNGGCCSADDKSNPANKLESV